MANLARYIFWAAGVWGLFILVPLFFQEKSFGVENPPAMNHPEFFYGFVGLAIVFQLLFLLMGTDPVRYRALMPICMLEKLSFAGPIAWLEYTGRPVPFPIRSGAAVDSVLLVLFVVAYLRTASGTSARVKGA